MASIRVGGADFDVGAEMTALTAGRSDIGGVGCFLGVVRGDGGLRSMSLEHYPGMTERALATIAHEAEARWALLGCTIVHRVGPLAPGENIVLVLAAAAHRQVALDATAFLIDWLKTRAPFWKQETLADGTGRWVDARIADDEAASRWGDLTA
jgi:molybdopterin synthase catalytic subunit